MWFDIAGACATLTLLLAGTAVGVFWRMSRQPRSVLEGLDDLQAQPAASAADVAALAV
jgi:hypothetical protein